MDMEKYWIRDCFRKKNCIKRNMKYLKPEI